MNTNPFRKHLGVLATALLLPVLQPSNFAQEPIILNDADPFQLVLKIDSRARYENADQDRLEESNAATLRNRIGLLAKSDTLSGYIEYEGTLALDRNSYRAASVHGPADHTIIADPESNEINQLWLQFSPFDSSAIKVGRQQISLNNERHLGPTPWRQNIQTFDAVTLTSTLNDNLNLTYGYFNQVNRAFGSQVTAAPQRDFEGDSHFVNLNYTGFDFGDLTLYTLVLDLNNPAGSNASNHTTGLILDGTLGDSNLAYWLEYAYQTDAFNSQLDYNTHYSHGYIKAPLTDRFSATFGLENRANDNNVGFQTPVARNHPFNGFADRFLGNVSPQGLTNFYAKGSYDFTKKLQGQLHYHRFWDGRLDQDLGDEIDFVLLQKLRDDLKLGVVGAFFEGASGVEDNHRFDVFLHFKR